METRCQLVQAEHGVYFDQFIDVESIAVLHASEFGWQIDINFTEEISGSALILFDSPIWTIADANGPLQDLAFNVLPDNQLELAGEFSGSFTAPLRVVIPEGANQVFSVNGNKKPRPGTYFSSA